jgi:hypothetical protein
MLVFCVRNAPRMTQVMFACVYNDQGVHGYHTAAMMEWGLDNVINFSSTRKYVSLITPSLLSHIYYWYIGPPA